MTNDPNKTYYESAGVPEKYAESTSLFEAEEEIFASLREELRGKAILDIGVGAGRTTAHLMDISKNYVGIDYSEKMIRLCGERFADATLMVCDARDMSVFDDEQFAAVFCCYNGIDEVPPPDRIMILKEVNRVLKKEGVFVFSSHNLDWEAVPFYSFGGLSFSPNPIRMIRDNTNRLRAYAAGLITRLRSMNNDSGCAVVLEHEKLTGMILPTYYISKEAQVRQLLEVGFCKVEAIDSRGTVIGSQKPVSDAWLYYVARKG
ncbi:MAG TPA: class I SAM-dependent methyltransferase [Blastocatellia bacterium]|nr:class I SAM-dependent methyltransferase [Blastocatellia bacterium]